MHNPKHKGALAQMEFMLRGMGMGMVVSEPYGDNARYDCVVDNGRRLNKVQVKSTGAVHSPNTCHVNVGRHKVRGKKNGFVPYLMSEIDFVAVHLTVDGLWYIIPQRKLVRRTQILLDRRARKKDGPFRENLEAWDLLMK